MASNVCHRIMAPGVVRRGNSRRKETKHRRGEDQKTSGQVLAQGSGRWGVWTPHSLGSQLSRIW